MPTQYYDPYAAYQERPPLDWNDPAVRESSRKYSEDLQRRIAEQQARSAGQQQQSPQSIQALSDRQQRLDEQRSRQYNSLPKAGAGSTTRPPAARPPRPTTQTMFTGDELAQQIMPGYDQETARMGGYKYGVNDKGNTSVPKRVNQTGDDYINQYDDNGYFIGDDPNVGFADNELWSPDSGYQKGRDAYTRSQEAQKAFMAMQGIQSKQDAASMKATQQLLANPGMQFGKGGGDWASAWSKAMQPQRGIFESLVGNQLGSFLDYGKGLNQTFNSATGPYGQMQAAAVATAPSRAQREISKDKLGMLSGLFEQMSANKTPSVSSVETDYGAYAKMLPSLMKKYLPGG